MSYSQSGGGGQSTPILKQSFIWFTGIPQNFGSVDFDAGTKLTLPNGKYKITRFSTSTGTATGTAYTRIRSDGRDVVNTHSPQVGTTRPSISGFNPSAHTSAGLTQFGVGCSMTESVHPNHIYIEGDLEISVFNNGATSTVYVIVEEYV